MTETEREIGKILSDLLCHSLIDCIARKCENEVALKGLNAWNDMLVISDLSSRVASKVKFDLNNPPKIYMEVRIGG